MNRLIRRVLLCWIVLTVMLLVLWVKAHAQSPYLESHSKIVNRRLAPPSLVKVGNDIYCVILVPRFAESKLLGLTSNEKKKIWILKRAKGREATGSKHGSRTQPDKFPGRPENFIGYRGRTVARNS